MAALVLGLVPGASRAQGAGGGVEAGASAWGLSVGHGLGTGLFGSSGRDVEDVDFVGLTPSYRRALSGPVAAETWLRGNVDLLVEAQLFVAYQPKGGFLGGVDAALRYNFRACGRLVPFVEIGIGVALLELDLDSQQDGLSFTPQGGVGLAWPLAPGRTLELGWRLYHLSNAGIHDDNDGINASLLTLGFTWAR
jgi:hypothetical protein